MPRRLWGRDRAMGPRCNLVRSRGKLRPFRAGYSSRPTPADLVCTLGERTMVVSDLRRPIGGLRHQPPRTR